MAIGSAPEIGVTFRRWGLMNETERRDWFRFMREQFGPDGVGGYGTIVYPERTVQDEV